MSQRHVPGYVQPTLAQVFTAVNFTLVGREEQNVDVSRKSTQSGTVSVLERLVGESLSFIFRPPDAAHQRVGRAAPGAHNDHIGQTISVLVEAARIGRIIGNNDGCLVGKGVLEAHAIRYKLPGKTTIQAAIDFTSGPS